VKTNALLLSLILSLSCGKAFASTAAAENFLKKSVGEVVEAAKNATDAPALASAVRPILLKTISFDAMTRRSVGPGWRQFTDAEQKDAIGFFTTLIIRTYSAKFTLGELPDVVSRSSRGRHLHAV
jgi:phospholipid transport system substrate-binding protein